MLRIRQGWSACAAAGSLALALGTFASTGFANDAWDGPTLHASNDSSNGAPSSGDSFSDDAQTDGAHSGDAPATDQAGQEYEVAPQEQDGEFATCEECGGQCQPAAAPAPNYGGCLHCRTKLTGDWGGHRTCLAEDGITFDFDDVLVYQGVAHGGQSEEFVFGGHGDYVINFDFGKMNVQQGLGLKIRAEHRYGQTINNAAGTLLSPALITSLPDPNSEDLMLTNVLFLQALSESFAVFAGKLDTLDGDHTAFASGRGKDQFLNTSMIFNPIFARIVPYSTLGAGFIVLSEGAPIFKFTVLNPFDTSDTAGFDVLFENGASLMAEFDLPTEFFGNPGHQTLTVGFSTATYTALNQDPRIVLPDNDIPINTGQGSWAIGWNFSHYLSVDPCNPAQGWGVFGRAGISDADPNPLSYFLSAGLGGNSWFEGRAADTWGVGWFYAGASEDLGPIATNLLGLRDGQGVELFYNYAVNPWFHVTPDLQILEPSRSSADTALLLGVRAKVDF